MILLFVVVVVVLLFFVGWGVLFDCFLVVVLVV